MTRLRPPPHLTTCVGGVRRVSEVCLTHKHQHQHPNHFHSEIHYHVIGTQSQKPATQRKRKTRIPRIAGPMTGSVPSNQGSSTPRRTLLLSWRIMAETLKFGALAV